MLKDEGVLQLIYSLEWYDIPKTSYNELITFHPYLTKDDYGKLSYATMNHRIENALSFVVFTLLSNRTMLSYGSEVLKKSRM